MKRDHCDECGGKPGGHKPYCSERFKGMDKENSWSPNDSVKKKFCIHKWQLIVAIIIISAVFGAMS